MFDLTQEVQNEVVMGALAIVFAIVATGLAIVRFYEKRYKEQK